MELTAADKSILLASAREAIQSMFGETPFPVADYSAYPALKTTCGAFVTLKLHNKLRGCIGYIVSDMSLFETVVGAARQAAFNDPRFYALTETELKDTDIEISVLSEMCRISEYSEIVCGRDGLLLDEPQRAVLLPQVAIEHNFSTEEFLSALCQKAGINRNEWQKRKLNLKSFTSVSFSETELKRRIYEQL